MKNPKKMNVTFSVSAEMYEKFKDACQIKMMCVSKVVEKLLNDFTKEVREESNNVV